MRITLFFYFDFCNIYKVHDVFYIRNVIISTNIFRNVFHNLICKFVVVFSFLCSCTLYCVDTRLYINIYHVYIRSNQYICQQITKVIDIIYMELILHDINQYYISDLDPVFSYIRSKACLTSISICDFYDLYYVFYDQVM